MSYIRIRKHYLHVPYLLLGVLEFLLLFASFFVVENIQLQLGVIPEARISIDPVLSLVYALLLSCCSLAMGVYLALMREGFLAMFFRTLVAYCFLGALSISLLAVVWPSINLGSTNLFWAIMASTGMALVVRRLFSGIIDSDQLARRVLVLGTGPSALQLKSDYENNKRSLSIRVMGYVGPSDGAIDGRFCLEKPSDWVAFCKANGISEIIVAQQERRQSDAGIFPLDDLIKCKMAGIDVVNAVSFYERELNKVKLSLLQPSWIIFSDGFSVSRSRDFAKRAFDLLVSLLLAIILALPVLFAALLVLLETGRPILYSQIRVGKDGQPFKIYKIRSMTKDAEKGGKAVWAKANDSRITKVGAFIRNTRLDEIPQLWNVVKGDMSFVGPRPERPEFVSDLNEQIPFYSYRHVVKPGLMGWAQLNYPYGASVEDAQGKLEYDLYYTKNHSIVMDLLIMIQTVEVVLLGKGVH
ncbi:TIGR03013 family XrtA/PEP-CTERM system glycosyltransferase [Reinekea marinisedimentorum]|uniref:Sugar transferase (PEP-CTERM system associated)/exopolysaccharide biosynthesis polyprenyl glycosylphosphotransferase n=1 Tax=Reinekea marinisedimentorum TaxID=230495 RepID=A0A4R3IBT7_9GAMM|nr:TIGR03013 family XrtA/PEP-CTERM system glycosyltransferase [Reinekea marinisedimentorum]TCS44100.1 sugar transferase (PEP-CTERM system associated)/exopolysaccharide biosynthesis polyprenyl glycosylphosphotransferase [Reinekea marinisedimentorum]